MCKMALIEPSEHVNKWDAGHSHPSASLSYAFKCFIHHLSDGVKVKAHKTLPLNRHDTGEMRLLAVMWKGDISSFSFASQNEASSTFEKKVIFPLSLDMQRYQRAFMWVATGVAYVRNIRAPHPSESLTRTQCDTFFAFVHPANGLFSHFFGKCHWNGVSCPCG